MNRELSFFLAIVDEDADYLGAEQAGSLVNLVSKFQGWRKFVSRLRKLVTPWLIKWSKMIELIRTDVPQNVEKNIGYFSRPVLTVLLALDDVIWVC